MSVQDREHVEMTQAEQADAQVAHAQRIVADSAQKGSIEHYGAMLLLAHKGRVDKLASVRADFLNVLRIAEENLRKG